ncbi:hypothetical protein H2198_006243 [Neophaeococcomyces mojaviensis]|uniref:Uncharacterized protein n=1 Tax=Neophaeococcomyces mojaviensis TaxID=3383035 RepID=A0ACC3A3V4_9EURO|nr:hypothetical protein H2198_006243 [Knufia sp. JES_112]
MILSRRFRNHLALRGIVVLLTARCLLDIVHYHSLKFSPPAGLSLPDRKPRIFIASTHWNNEPILRNHGNGAVIQLVHYFAPENTFVSVYESGSWDDSKQALRELEKELEWYNVVLEETTHEEEVSKPPEQTGWLDTPRGRKELRRIPYLSRLRNLSLEPLQSLAKEGIMFDTILFLNDVIFTLDDVPNLLGTHDGDYAAACSLDFSEPLAYYDTFALRDSAGHETVMSTWPYFRSSVSRSAIKRGDPVPVSSCWNGMVFMRAEPFYETGEGSHLRFRGIPDSLARYHLEGSECCLIHQDNPLSPQRGVFVNPHVRVGYNREAFDAMNGRAGEVTLLAFLFRSWENRILRLVTTDWFKLRTVSNRLAQWRRADLARDERGISCLVDEMQVLANNGWAHV